MINHIEAYMEQFGMLKTRIDKNELFYQNIKFYQNFSRSRLIRSLSYTIDVTDNEVIVIIETSTIFPFVVAIGCILFSPFVSASADVFIPMIIGIVFFAGHSMIKLSALESFKSDVGQLLHFLSDE